MISNDTEMTAAELLDAYKRQPRLERRHATFKSVIHAAPIELTRRAKRRLQFRELPESNRERRTKSL